MEKVEKEKAPLSDGQKSKETETEENKDSKIPGGSLDLLKFSYHIQIGTSPLRVTRCPWEAPAGGQPAEEMKDYQMVLELPCHALFSPVLTEVLLVAWQPPRRSPGMPPY